MDQRVSKRSGPSWSLQDCRTLAIARWTSRSRARPDQPGAGVPRIGFAGEVAVPLQVGNELVHGLLGHAGMDGQLGRCGALDSVEPENLQVRRPQCRV
jgi:hypothetical protein